MISLGIVRDIAECKHEGRAFTVQICYWGEYVREDILEKCAKLFSEHYGSWGDRGVKPGHRVSLSAKRLRSEYLFNPKTCTLVTAMTKDDNVVGHAFVCCFPYLEGTVAWVTQLVVRSDMRNKGIATRLLAKVSTEECIAWGLVTSHPYAVRALEKATHRKCVPILITKHTEGLIQASQIPYVQNCKYTVSDTQSIIHSDFYVDHTIVSQLLTSVKTWNLGVLDEGDEFFAFLQK